MPVLVIPTGTVTGQVVDVTGQPADGVLVVATLRAGQTTPQTIAPAGQVVPSEISTFTDASGFWSLSLVPNSNITPANTTYVISVPGMPDVQISLTDTASHPYLSLAVSPIGATLVTAGQTITGPLTISGGITGPNPWYDVKAYGAKGDGVTDDTAAIQLALDTAGASVGGVVWVPPGTYITSARLVVPFSVEFRGAGRNSTTLKAANTFPINTEMVRLGDLSGSIGVSCRIVDFKIDCNNISGSKGVYSERINENSGVYHVAVSNYGSRGVQISQPGSGGIPQHFTIYDLEVYSGTATGAAAIGLEVAMSSLSIPIREISGVTVFATGSTQLTTAVKVDGITGQLRNIHVENAVNGVLVGSVLACFGLVIMSADGLANVTNLIVLSSATTQDSITCISINPSGGANSIVDQIHSNTITSQVAFYAIGNGGAANAPVITTNITTTTRFRNLSMNGPFHPGTPATGFQNGAIYQGAGVPSNANGADGDVYFRTDTPGTVNQRMYIRAAGAWVALAL